MESRIVTIVGGTGFLGRYVARRLAKAGYMLRIIARRPEAAAYLKTAGDVGQVVLMAGDVTQPKSLSGKLDHSFAVVNLAGILFESGRHQRFDRIHAEGAEALARMAKTAKAQRFIHVSALGVDKAPESTYAKTKLLGEKHVQAAFPEATVLRPSVIFGAEDNFFNQFAGLAALLPALPLIGGGKTRFQPVYVDDVAAAIETCLTRPETKGQTYELGGPQVYSFKELLEYILRATGRRCALVPIPFSLAALAGMCAGILPRPPLTADQVRLLKYDNVVTANAKTFLQLGIKAREIDEVVPDYLERFAKHSRAA